MVGVMDAAMGLVGLVGVVVVGGDAEYVEGATVRGIGKAEGSRVIPTLD